MEPSSQLIIQICEEMCSCLPARKDVVGVKQHSELPILDDVLKKQHDVLGKHNRKRDGGSAKQYRCKTVIATQLLSHIMN